MEKIYKDLLKEIWLEYKKDLLPLEIESLNSEDETVSNMIIDVILNKLNICEIVINFSGSGDSGNDAEISYIDDNINEDYIGSNIAEEIIDQKVDFDYYNNDGGEGTITIDYKVKTCHILGNQYFQSSNEVQNELINI